MKELVFLQNEQVITTSLKVAEVFEKEHFNVVRDIRNLIQEMASISQNSNLKGGVNTPMFQESSYQAEEGGRSYPMYFMNRDGFTLLAMGFTGQKALKFKLAYIDAFNAMEKKLIELLAERQSANWLEVRQSTKFTQRKLTDAVKEFVIPNARKNGSTAPDKVFYMTYNKLFNKVANVPAGQRDNLTISQLIMLDQMQDVAAANIRIKAKRGANYKDIYSVTKTAVEGYAQIALVQERLQLK